MSRRELIVRGLVLFLAMAWVGWQLVRDEVYTVPAERAERCQQAKDRERLRPSAFASDEVHYYCVRAR